jgi:hypothetical protein
LIYVGKGNVIVETVYVLYANNHSVLVVILFVIVVIVVLYEYPVKLVASILNPSAFNNAIVDGIADHDTLLIVVVLMLHDPPAAFDISYPYEHD